MMKHIREVAPPEIENVSRRGVLKGILSTTGLVLAVSLAPSRPAFAADDAPGARQPRLKCTIAFCPTCRLASACQTAETPRCLNNR